MITAKTNRNDFRQRMHTIAAGIPAHVDEIIRAYSDSVIYFLFAYTPVDTAQLRYNWQVTIGTDWDGFLPLSGYDKLRGKHTPDVAAQNAAEALAHAQIAAYKSPAVLYITNAAPYAVFQNDGTDKLPPRYFLEDAMTEARKVLEQFKLIG